MSYPLLLVLLFPTVSYNATPEDEYNKIQEKMLEQKNKLKEAQKREYSILSEIDDVNVKVERTEEDLKKYRDSLGKTESEISRINTEILRIQNNIERQKDFIRRKLRIMHRFGYSGDIFTLMLGSRDIPQMMRIWKYLENITLYEHRVLKDYHENVRILEEKSLKLRHLRTSLSVTTEKIMTKENELAQIKKAKEAILSSVRKEKAARQKMLGELKEASKRMLAIINEASKKDTYIAQGFPELKGKISWPVEGRIAVPYGSQKDPQFDTPLFRNGIHIRTGPNANAKAVSTGKVIFAELFKGFGQLIIINHGSGYHTLYGNLSEIFSRVGDIIKENQVIGRVGSSGLLNDHGLYFEIRYKGKPLDPTQWLRRKRG